MGGLGIVGLGPSRIVLEASLPSCCTGRVIQLLLDLLACTSRGALVASVLVVAVILAALVLVLRESVIFLILLISPLAHHVAEFNCGPGEISSEFLVSHLHVESVAEATDGVFVGDLCDCCTCFEETTHIRS